MTSLKSDEELNTPRIPLLLFKIFSASSGEKHSLKHYVKYSSRIYVT